MFNLWILNQLQILPRHLFLCTILTVVAMTHDLSEQELKYKPQPTNSSTRSSAGRKHEYNKLRPPDPLTSRVVPEGPRMETLCLVKRSAVTCHLQKSKLQKEKPLLNLSNNCYSLKVSRLENKEASFCFTFHHGKAGQKIGRYRVHVTGEVEGKRGAGDKREENTDFLHNLTGDVGKVEDVVMQPLSRRVTIGERVVFSCSIHSGRPSQASNSPVTWYHLSPSLNNVVQLSSKRMARETKYRFRGIRSDMIRQAECSISQPCTYTLTVRDLTQADGGIYFCTLSPKENMGSESSDKAESISVEGRLPRGVNLVVLNDIAFSAANGDVEETEPSDPLTKYFRNHMTLAICMTSISSVFFLAIPSGVFIYMKLCSMPPVETWAKSKTRRSKIPQAFSRVVKSGSTPLPVTPVGDEEDGVRDDDQGHLVFLPGTRVTHRWKVLRELGEGQFSKVCKVLDISSIDREVKEKKRKYYALKIIRNIPKYRDAAVDEISVLKKLQTWDPAGRRLCIQMLSRFDFHGHICLVFPLLGDSVYDFLKSNDYHPYPLKHVRHILYQLCYSVAFLHEHGLTHTDLKPENMLLVSSAYTWHTSIDNPNKEFKVLRSTHIRLCDFGSAVFDHEHHSTIIQTRHYRAPEVILELGWWQACDVWSCGCILFELYDGDPLFLTHDTREHLAMMQRILGSIPEPLTRQTKKQYFVDGRLDWDYESTAGKRVIRKFHRLRKYQKHDTDEHNECFDLMERMLVYEPNKRINIPQTFEHRFLKGLPYPQRLYDQDKEAQRQKSQSTVWGSGNAASERQKQLTRKSEASQSISSAASSQMQESAMSF